jgi:hypothetical protein
LGTPSDFLIPKALFPITVDGQVHLDTEYLGAETVALEYEAANHHGDAQVYLVYRDEPDDQNLYIAVTNLRDVAEARRADSWVGISFDADSSRDGLAWTDFQIRAPLSAEPATFWVGQSEGDFLHLSEIQPGPSGLFDVAYDYLDEFAPPRMEFRIARSLLGEWTDIDGMAIGHFNVAEDGDNYLVPPTAVANSPATWGTAAYVANTTIVPLVQVAANVYDRDALRVVNGYHVRLLDDENGVLLDARATQLLGEADFTAAVPPNRTLRLEIEERPNHLYLRTLTHAAGVQSISTGRRHVVFPGVNGGPTQLARVEFYIRRPIAAVTLTSYAPAAGVPRLRLRDVPEKLLAARHATQVTLFGTNLHSEIQVFLYGCLDLDPQHGPQELLGCLPDRDYFEARIVDRAQDDSWIRVEVPHVPRPVRNSRWGREWGWVVLDSWSRPQRNAWTRIGGSTADHFTLRLPPYPLVSGFAFDNEPFEAVWNDYEAVFGDDIFRATADTPFGEVELFCLPAARPEALVYFPVFLGTMAASGGSCVGMAATSQLLHRLELDPERASLNSDDDAEGVHFANGFTRSRRTVYVSAERNEPRSDCEHEKPRNLAAHIRVNHGVQSSKEFIQALLDQMVGGLLSIEGDPASVLDRVRNNPAGFVIDMIPGIGDGHVVTPYAVIDGINGDGDAEDGKSLIMVYDNNHPGETNRFVEIDVGSRRSTFRFPRSSNISDRDARWDGHWSGKGIYAVPIDIFRRRRSLPGLEDALEFVRLFVFGDADGLYTAADGEWGWREDGTVVDRLPGARSITPLGGRSGATRHVMLFMPAANPMPTVHINCRGAAYSFHAAGGGRWLEVERRDSIAGDRDHAEVSVDGGQLSWLRYRPQRRATDVTARLLVTPGVRQRVLYELSDLRIGPGRTLVFTALTDGRGIEVLNDSGEGIRPSIVVHWIDEKSKSYGTHRFESAEVPTGAVQRLTIGDWPHATEMRSELDVNRDGRPERVDLLKTSSSGRGDTETPRGPKPRRA